jgi:2-amino-4-hydroxy-6-hydroxymethyldihydropteridine diphosphokinase
MALALLSLGSNLGDRRSLLQAALAELGSLRGAQLVAASAFHETSPIGGPAGQGKFLNAAAVLETSLSPAQLLAETQRIESSLGRTRPTRWDARTLDIDVLLYDDLVVNLPTLALPHPRMVFRRFVLEPAVEVAPEMLHPLTLWSVRRLWEHLNASLPYVALADAGGTYAPRLALEISRQRSVRLIYDPEEQAKTSQLARLDRWRRLLALSDWPQPSPPTVSDFWFDLAAPLAAQCLNATQLARFQDAWQTARQEVAQPRLVIRLDVPDSLWPMPRPATAPWLQLDARDLPAATEEVVAAIDAMQ